MGGLFRKYTGIYKYKESTVCSQINRYEVDDAIIEEYIGSIQYVQFKLTNSF